MKYAKFLIIGFIFGIAIFKSEAMTWYRIQEMFRFQSFHMYGIFGSAIAVGAITVLMIKKLGLKTIEGEEIVLEKKPLNKKGNIIGGVLFGIGWAFTGCCVAPMYVLVGYGSIAGIVILISAFIGVWVYGEVREKLPH
jgi:uncharacterized membrane protein YedE/YeeE